MIKFAIDQKLPHKIILLYSSRNSDEVIFREQLQEFEMTNPDLKIVHTITCETERKFDDRPDR